MRNNKKDFYTLIILFGVVSLLADIVYEGARSISGDYINYLKGPAIAAGLIGAGELLGYGFRFVSGVFSLKFRSEKFLWAIVFVGYAIQAVFIPLLAFTGSWGIAVILYLLERVGKGLRTPARDALLAEVSKSVGRGLGFGIHEVLDQLGAITGPLLVGLTYSYGGYRPAFLVLVVPGALNLLTLFYLMKKYYLLKPAIVEDAQKYGGSASDITISDRYTLLYFLFVALLSIGFIHWSIISYYMSYELGKNASEIAYLYSIAMLADALIAIPIGVLFDKKGLKTLLLVPSLALFLPVFLVLATSTLFRVLSAIVFGLVMSAFETILRSAIPAFVAKEKLAYVYGVFGLIQGTSWFAGSMIISYLYQTLGKITAFIYLPIPAIMISLVLLLAITKKE